MALFGRKKEKEEVVADVQQGSAVTKKATPKKKMVVSGTGPKGTAHPLTLKSPRITEKATELTQKGNVYVFNVAVNATKKEVAKSIETVYGVTPVRINMLKVRGKNVSGRRGLGGKTAGGKKAYVFLKKGDSITLV